MKENTRVLVALVAAVAIGALVGASQAAAVIQCPLLESFAVDNYATGTSISESVAERLTPETLSNLHRLELGSAPSTTAIFQRGVDSRSR